MNYRSLLTTGLLVLPVIPAARAYEAAAVINEIHYNGAAPTDPEWIELTNQLSIDVDLGGWRLTGGADFTFPAGTTLRAGGFLVVSDLPAALQSAAGITGVLGPWTGSLNNSGETLRLRDLSGRVMEEVSYNDRGRWPSGADGSGATLARKGGHTSGRTADGWELSKRVGGSPGQANDSVQLAPPVTVFGDSAAWLFHDTSAGLAAGWQSTGYTAGAGGWLSGNGVLAFEDAVLPAAVGTVLATPAAHPTGTYYFQKQFNFAGTPAQHQFTLRTLVDDGAVIYLNGSELTRRNMAAGAVTAATASSGEVGNASFADISIPSAALVNGTNTLSVEVHNAGRLIVPGGGGGGPLTLVQTGGAIMATNFSTAAGAAPFAKDVIPAAPTHSITWLNNGTYGNPSSWIGNSLNSFCGISFGTTRTIGSVAWGRDNTGTFSDRNAGTYTVQYTTEPTVNAATTAWTTIGTINYATNSPANAIRHVYSFTAVNATGIRLICPGNSFADGACVDELEAGPYIAPPPPPAPVFRLMATGGNMDNPANMALGATPFAKDLVGNGIYAPTHTVAGINDGIYGNPNSWIGETAGSYAGVGFPSLRQIGRVAWGRDNTGTYFDRAEGVYTVQYTTVLNPNASTPAGSWTTIGDITMDSTVGSPASRHLLEFAPVNASGIRIITPGAGVGSGACIDELEIYAPATPDVVWSASLSSREIIPPASAVTLAINEIGGALDGVWRVELRNTGSSSFDIGGLILAGSDAPLAGYTLPAQMLAPGAVVVLDETQLGFRPGEDDRLFLYGAGRTGVVDSAIVRANGRARSADGRMLVPAAASFGGANSFALNTAIVISEVMYHFPGSDEEWIELYNKSASPVDVSGWRLDDAVTFTFPGLPSSNTTVIPAGGYLVISGNAPALLAKWPGRPVIGDFSGSLNNRGERIALEDASGNPVAEVTYADGGKWPSLADGGGSSLELRDVLADNAHPASWAASDESAKSTMQTFTYRLVSGQPNGPSFWNEFRFGMLDAGVCMVDDLSVKRDPDGAAAQIVQNGAFSTATAWRFLGNHAGSGVVTDGANGSVLRLDATGPAETNHNHAETTFSAALVDAQTYEVSFRARWISGSNKLGTRGYFSRIAKAHDLPVPQNLGTPGAANSRAGTAGPSLSALRHSPVSPGVSQAVTVSCTAGDSRPITGVTLNYSTGGAFTPVAMTNSAGTWSASIPGQTAGTVVQFYVSAANNAGGNSALPAAGANSRALYIVQDGQASNVPAREMRIIMFPADSAAMLTSLNLLSNATRGGTLVTGGTDVFYDVGVRLQGSAAGRARDGTDFQGINVELNSDEKYLGLYGSVGFDRSGRAPANRRPDEIYAKHLFHRAGLPATRDDLAYLVGPTTTYTGHSILQLHSYGGDFPDDQFGTEGSIFNFDGTYEPTTNSVSGNVQTEKNPVPFTHHQTDLVNLGDKEHFRGFFDIRGGKERDDYAPLMAMCTSMGLTAGAQFDAETDERIDVDQWMRCTALVNLLGVGDSWFTGGFPHNARFWVPTAGKAVQLPWDMDFMLSTATNAPINMTNGNLGKLVARPNNNRAYLAHVRDLCMTALDPAYVQTWLTSYGTVTNHNYAASVSWLNARRTYALSVLPATVPFAISTNGGADFSVNAHTATLTGTGYLDIRSIQRNGSVIPLNVRWTSSTAWTADLALVPGPNAITLNALAFDGTTLNTDTITITDTLPAPLPRDFLRITEVHYHPAAPSTTGEIAASLDADDFEFIELMNTGTGALDLTGVRFTSGIAFTFPSMALAGGARLVVVKNPTAFTARYGAGPVIAGSYPTDNLRNSGETITLVDATGAVIQSFTYDDAWAPLSDGTGRSLIIRDPAAATTAWQTAAGWALSTPGGTPGNAPGAILYTEFALWQHTHFNALQLADPAISSAAADPAGQGISNLVRYALGLTPADNALNFLPSATITGGTLRIEFRRLKAAADISYLPESSTDLTVWNSIAELPAVQSDNGDGTETMRVNTSASPARRQVRLRVE